MESTNSVLSLVWWKGGWMGRLNPDLTQVEGGRFCERGRAWTHHSHQAGRKIPSWLNVHKNVAITNQRTLSSVVWPVLAMSTQLFLCRRDLYSVQLYCTTIAVNEILKKVTSSSFDCWKLVPRTLEYMDVQHSHSVISHLGPSLWTSKYSPVHGAWQRFSVLLLLVLCYTVSLGNTENTNKRSPGALSPYYFCQNEILYSEIVKGLICTIFYIVYRLLFL